LLEKFYQFTLEIQTAVQASFHVKQSYYLSEVIPLYYSNYLITHILVNTIII